MKFLILCVASVALAGCQQDGGIDAFAARVLGAELAKGMMGAACINQHGQFNTTRLQCDFRETQ